MDDAQSSTDQPRSERLLQGAQFAAGAKMRTAPKVRSGDMESDDGGDDSGGGGS